MKQIRLTGNDPPVMTVRLHDFSFGLDTSTAEGLLPDGAAVAMDHVCVEDRTLKTAKGITPINEFYSMGFAVRSLMTFDKEGERQVLAVLDNGQLWDMATYNQPFLFMNDFGAAPTSSIWYQNRGKEVLLFGNATGGVWHWDGSRLRAILEAPKPNAMILHKERVWILPADDPMAVQCCRDMNPEDWSQSLDAGALIRILTWDGTRCIGLKSVFEDVIVAKERSLWRISGSDPTNFQLSPVYSGRGAIANRSLAVCDGGMAFLSEDGVFFYDGVRCRALQSARIKGIMQGMNPRLRHTAAGVFFKDKYYLSFAMGESRHNDTVLCYHFGTGSWTVRHGVCVNDWAVAGDQLLCGMQEGYVAEYESGETILGTPYRGQWTGALRGLDGMAVQKTLQSVTLTARGQGTLHLRWQFDQSRERQVSVTLTPDWRTRTLQLDGTGKMVRFGITGGVGSTFEVADAAFDLRVVPCAL